MVSKRQIKREHVRHPYTKKKLLVIDNFEPNEPTICPACNVGMIKQIRVVESEYRGGVRYNLITCEKCEQAVWVVPS